MTFCYHRTRPRAPCVPADSLSVWGSFCHITAPLCALSVAAAGDVLMVRGAELLPLSSGDQEGCGRVLYPSGSLIAGLGADLRKD